MLNHIDQFINWIRRRNPKTRTWRDYKYDLAIFVRIVGDLDPNAVTYSEIDDFIQHQLERGFAPSTINRRLASVISFYTFLSAEYPLIRCPVIPRRHHMREPHRLPRPVPLEDLELFFSLISSVRDRAMFLLMLRCGLRISEVAKLRLTDLFLSESPPRIVVSGKGNKERSVYLSPQAERSVLEFLVQRKIVPCQSLFLSYQNKGLSTTAIHKRLMKYRNASGVHFTAHQLRHSFASDLLAVDTPVTTIQKLLGHRWLETTQTYIQANDPQVQRDFYLACDKLENWQ